MSGTRRRGRIDRAHVIRRGEDATRQLPSRFFENTCGTFQAAISISWAKFDTSRRLSFPDTHVHTYLLLRADRTPWHCRGHSFYDPPHAFDHQFLIGGVFINDGFEGEHAKSAENKDYARCKERRGCDVEREEDRRRGINITHRLDRIFWK